MLTRRRLFSMTTCLPLLALSAMAGAADDDNTARKVAMRQAQEEALRALQRGEILPLSQVLESAK